MMLNRIKFFLIVAVLLLTQSLVLMAQKNSSDVNYMTVNDLPYSVKTDSYARERLKVDVYYPQTLKNCPVVVWFHGGGLTSGHKGIPVELKKKGLVVIGVNYRLLPNVTIDSCCRRGRSMGFSSCERIQRRLSEDIRDRPFCWWISDDDGWFGQGTVG